MATMQARNCLSEVLDTDVLPNAIECIGLDRISSPIATGRKHLDGFSAPIGGATGLVGNNPVIWTIQIVPCRMHVFLGSILSLLRKTDRDPSPGGDPFSLDQFAHIDEW